MSRLPSIGDDAADPIVRAAFAEVKGRGLAVPNLYRALANAPAMFRAWLDFAWPLRLNATTPRALRELMIMRGAQVSGAEYEWVHHWPMAEQAGVPAAKLAALADWPSSGLYDAEERVCLRLVDEVNRDGGASADCMSALVAHFGAEAAVELTLTASFYVCVSRMLRSLGIEIEPGYERYLPAMRPEASGG